jgi:PAS domain S-box-containing protein
MALLVVGFLLTWRAVIRSDHEMRAELLGQGQRLAQTINVEHLRALAGTDADLGTTIYQRLKEQFTILRGNNPHCRFFYLLGRREDGKLFFLVDSESPESRAYSPPGQAYDEASAISRRVFATRIAAVEGPDTDRWGTWVTALVPIHDPQTAMSGLATTDDAQAMVRKAVAFYRQHGRDRLLREINNPQGEFHQGDLYAFAYDRTMTMLAHPVKPELVGKNLLDKKDWSGGKYFRREIRDVALAKGNGWVDYEYENPANQQRAPKTTYVERVDDLILCAGAYKGSGVIMAVLGMDIDAHQWRWMLARAALPPLLLTLALVAVVLGGRVLLTRRSRMAGASPAWMQHLEPALVIVVGFIVTLFIAGMVDEGQTKADQEAFGQLASSRTQAIAEILRDLRDTRLEGLAHFLESSTTVTAENFQEFTTYLTKNPVVRAWEWVPAVAAADRTRFEADARAAGLSGFAIWQADGQGKRLPVAGREAYDPVLQVAPLVGNERTLGHDLGSDPVASAALEEAMRTGLTTGSAPILLKHETGSQQGMLICRPVFSGKDGKQLRGFAVAVLGMETLRKSAVMDNTMTIGLSLLGQDAVPVPLASSWEAAPLADGLAWTRPILAFGKVFAVTAHEGKERPRPSQRWVVWLAVLMGMVVTVTCAMLIRVVLSRQDELERQVVERTRELQKLSSAVSNSPSAIVITDDHGRIEYVNPKFTEITGYSPQEAIGKQPRILNSGTHPKELFQELWCTILAGSEWRGDLCNRKKNGDLYWEHSSISPIKDQEGRITHFVAIKEDVSAQKRIAEALLIAQHAAQAANRAKSDFLANMSHEIRTPLNAIIGFSALTLETPLPPQQYDYIHKVNTAGTLLLSLINDILDFSKIEAGQLHMESIPFRLATTLADTITVLQHKAVAKGLELRVETAPEIAPCLVGDPHRLGQVIVNLVGNAVKFTEQGEVTLVTAMAGRDGERMRLRFEVRDTGMGLTAEQIPKLFQPFTQADGSTTRRFGGTGLGLSICKQLVELMGGEIWCESTAGQGSRFCFTAWFSTCPEQEEHSLAAEALEVGGKMGAFDFAGCRVLLVEDNETNQQLALALLAKTGVGVDLAVNGQEAVTMVIAGKAVYDLVLMDIQMPVLDGYEATRRIRADPRFAALPIIAMTAHAMRDERQKITQAGMDAFIAKPIDARAMLRTMATFLGTRERGADPAASGEIPPAGGGGAALPVVAGLDVAAALKRLAGDEDLYRFVLRSFATDHAQAAGVIREALTAGDPKAAVRHAHSLKGIAGTMGAVELERLALLLQKGIAQGEASATVDAALASFAAEVERLVTELRTHLPMAA